MNVEGRIAALEKRHQALDDEVRRMTACPSSSDAAISEMKRQKLFLKDEMTSLRASAEHI